MRMLGLILIGLMLASPALGADQYRCITTYDFNFSGKGHKYFYVDKFSAEELKVRDMARLWLEGLTIQDLERNAEQFNKSTDFIKCEKM